jgi:hypothetical protein
MNQSLSDFLHLIPAQKEVSLIVAQDQLQLKEFQIQLIAAGFNQISQMVDLYNLITQPSKSFISPTPDQYKTIYDFAIQYPTGQVDHVSPLYDQVSLVILLTKDHLYQFQSQKLPLLNVVGLTF